MCIVDVTCLPQQVMNYNCGTKSCFPIKNNVSKYYKKLEFLLNYLRGWICTQNLSPRQYFCKFILTLHGTRKILPPQDLRSAFLTASVLSQKHCWSNKLLRAAHFAFGSPLWNPKTWLMNRGWFLN